VNSSQSLLSGQQIQKYKTDGFLFQREVFPPHVLSALRREAEAEFAVDAPWRTVEKNSGAVRAVHGSHLHNNYFARLVRLPQLLAVARELLADNVYVYQFKINAKRAFKGEIWEWHQDYIFWHHEDGMPCPRALTAAVFLDDVTEFNGPLMFLRSGHRGGMIDVEPKSDDMISSLEANLKYSLSLDTIRSLADRCDLSAPTGPKGSVLWFDCNMPHGSAPNMSPFDRSLLLITYNSVNNIPSRVDTRPGWLVGRDSTPLEIGEEDELADL
jgi:Phytanoyl-CoA dioxygenase (PhyH)